MRKFEEDKGFNNLRIAYFAGTMKRGHDGVTRVLYKLNDYLNDNNIEHIFFSAIAPSEKEFKPKVFEVPSIAFPGYNEYRVALPGHKHFEEKLREFNPDIIHINSPCPLGYAAAKFGQRNGIPVAATYHTHFASYATYYKVKALEPAGWSYLRKLYNKCSAVYVPSTPIKEELIEHGIKNTYFLPHGVDTEVFNTSFKSETWKKELGIEGKTALLFAGRLVWEKDLRILADTYKILSKRRDDFALVIAGDGPARQELEKLMPGALFQGYLGGDELSTAYASSDIFVFPSTTETFGNVTIEAMASGIPPVCANKGGAAGFIEQGKTGMLAKPRDPEDMAAKIELLIYNPQIRRSIAENALVFSQRQTWRNIFNRQLENYKHVIEKYHRKKSMRSRHVA